METWQSEVWTETIRKYHKIAKFSSGLLWKNLPIVAVQLRSSDFGLLQRSSKVDSKRFCCHQIENF